MAGGAARNAHHIVGNQSKTCWIGIVGEVVAVIIPDAIGNTGSSCNFYGIANNTVIVIGIVHINPIGIGTGNTVNQISDNFNRITIIHINRIVIGSPDGISLDYSSFFP